MRAIFRTPPAALALLLALIAVGAARAALPCAETDRECAKRAAYAHPLRQAAGWSVELAKPVEQRIGPAFAALVEFLTIDNIKNDYPNRPRASNLTPEFLADVRAAIAELPPAVKRVLEPSFAGLYFVDDLGGTGYTDSFAADGKPAGAYVVLDATVLGKLAANDWATWKEGTPFKAAPGHAIRARIEEDAGNNRRNAIQYILLHELGHVLSVGRDIHPPWDIAPKDVPADRRYPFFELSWTLDRAADRYASLFDDGFAQRRSIAYYFGAKLEAADMVPVYEALERTNFPTLYAATHPGDDFAESFVTYVHVVVMKKPFSIELLRDGKVVKTYRPCWEEARCAAKRAILEKLLR